jgi:outer membrane protein TolC
MKPILAALTILAALPLKAEEVTLEDYLQLVRRNHPFFTKENLRVTIEEKEAEALLGGQEWILRIAPAYTHLGEASASQIPADTLDQATAQADLSRLFWSTGGTLSLGLSSEYANTRGTPYGDTESYSQGISVSYAQPLLRNRGGVLYRLGHEVAAYNQARVRVEIKESQEGVLLHKAQGFLDWSLATEQVRIAERRLELARALLGQTERRHAANLVDRLDVLRAADEARVAEQALIELRSLARSKQAELAVLAGTESLREATPLFDLYRLAAPPDVDADVAALAGTARILKPFAVTLEQLAARRRALREELRSELTLSVHAALNGIGEQASDSLDVLNPDLTVALEYRVPSGHVTTEAGIAATEARRVQIREEMRSIAVELEAQLRALAVQLGDTADILTLGGQQIESAQQKTEEELRLYNQGRGQLAFVIQSRDGEQRARLAQAANAARYQGLRLQYRALTDALLVED